MCCFNKIRLQCLVAFVAITFFHANSASATNLLRNPGFEDVPNSDVGQGILPNEWYQASGVDPGADTYSNDGSYGLNPADFTNFTEGTVAEEGIRFVAGWSNYGSPESFGQTMTTPFITGFTYTLTGWLHDSSGDAQTDDGGYLVQLQGATTSYSVGALYASGNGTNAWQFSTTEFVVPESSEPLTEIVFIPFTTQENSTYFGLDDLNLTVHQVTLAPTATTISLGNLVLGDNNSLASNDNDAIKICKGFVPTLTSPRIRFDSDFSSPFLAPSDVTVTLKARMTTAGVFKTRVFVADRTGGGFVYGNANKVIGDDPINTSFAVFAGASANPTVNVHTDGTMRTRVEIQQTGFSAVTVPCAEFEQLNVTVTQ